MIAEESLKKLMAYLLWRRMDDTDLIVKAMEEHGGVSIARRTSMETRGRAPIQRRGRDQTMASRHKIPTKRKQVFFLTKYLCFG